MPVAGPPPSFEHRGLLSSQRAGNLLLPARPWQFPPDWGAQIHEIACTPGQRFAWDERLPLGRVIFPISALISETVRMADGASAEIATVGREGVIGLERALGMARHPVDLVVTIPGSALETTAEIGRQLARDPALAARLSSFAAF